MRRPSKLVEAVARAICSSYVGPHWEDRHKANYVEEHWLKYVDAALSAIEAIKGQLK